MALRVGSPAEGDDFFDRLIERAQLWDILVANHVVLTAPRRLGKTSLLKQLCSAAADHGLLAVYLDVSALRTPQELIQLMEQELPQARIIQHIKTVSSAVGGWLSRLGKVKLSAAELGSLEVDLQASPSADWREQAGRLRQRLSQQPVLIVLDEFSVFVHHLLHTDRAQAEQLLAVLRSWRQQSGVVCRFIFSGSIGLNSLLERHGLQTETNDCYDFRLGPFALPDAQAMLLQLSAREGWPMAEATAVTLCERVSWLSPYYLMLVLQESIRAAMTRLRVTGPCGQALTPADVDQGLAQLLDSRSTFSHWYQRLSKHHVEPELSWLRHSLSRLAAREGGLRISTLLAAPGTPASAAELLIELEEHGYTVQDGQQVRFQSPLLRHYWKKNHAK